MSPLDKTPPSQSEVIAFELDLPHAPAKVWRALTEPALLGEWLLPVLDLELLPGAEFRFQAPPQPGWDGAVQCRVLEIDADQVGEKAWSDHARVQPQRCGTFTHAGLEQHRRGLEAAGVVVTAQHHAAELAQPLVTLEQADLGERVDHALSIGTDRHAHTGCQQFLRRQEAIPEIALGRGARAHA